MTIPGQPEVEAAWLALPADVRNRIGTIAVDMVFRAYVHGDFYVATGHPAERPVPGESEAAHAIRAEADEASNARLTELHKVVERAIPDLFGPAGENPEWAVKMGALR